MREIKEYFKGKTNNKIVKVLWNIAKIMKYSVINRCAFWGRSTYSYLFSTRTRSIKQYHNKFKGKRCFIVATGPSLTYDDLELIKDEYTFSMNSIVMGFEKSNWRPTFYGIQDEYVYEKVKDDLLKSKLNHVFVGDKIARLYSILPNWKVFYVDKLNQRIETDFHNHYYTKFSGNFAYKAYDGYTIAYSLIQLAVYMGFSEIYLLGCDCNYEKGKQQHFIEHGHIDSSVDTLPQRMFVAYEVAREYADKNGIKIYNATRGGMLEVFPRVKLEEVVHLK